MSLPSLPRLPSHWSKKRLKHVASVFPSNVDKHSVEGEVPVRLCNYTDVYYNEIITPNLSFMSATATPAEIERFTLRPGDVLFTKDSETADDIGIPAIVSNETTEVLCGYHLSIARASDAVLGSYIWRLFQSRYVRSYFETRANGLTRVGLGQYAVDNVEIPVPPLAEQRIIAAYLDRETARIDGLVERLKRLITLLTEKRQAVISHAVTKGLDPSASMKDSGIDWLGEVPAHWEVKRLKHVMPRIEQGWSPDCEARIKEDAEWGVLKAGCVNGWSFAENEHKALPGDMEPRTALEVKSGDLLMSRANTRDLVGSVALVGEVQERLLLCDKLYRLRIDERLIEPAFALFVLRSRVARVQYEVDATGASGSMQNIGQDTVQNLVLTLPPLEEQVQIARYLETERAAADRAKEALTSIIQRTKERRAALISAAVTGQIPLPEMTPAPAEAAE